MRSKAAARLLAEGQAAHTMGVFDGTSDLRIGGRGSVNVDGRMGPTMFFKSAAGEGGVLSASQRAWLYNSGAGQQYPLPPMPAPTKTFTDRRSVPERSLTTSGSIEW